MQPLDIAVLIFFSAMAAVSIASHPRKNSVVLEWTGAFGMVGFIGWLCWLFMRSDGVDATSVLNMFRDFFSQ